MSEVAHKANTLVAKTTDDVFLQKSEDFILVYRPDTNSFIALDQMEWLECRAEGHANKTAIEELQEANRKVTEASLHLHELLRQPLSHKNEIDDANTALENALNELDKKSTAAKKRIEPLVNTKIDDKKLVEILPLTMKRVEGKPLKTPIYINSEKLKKALSEKRVYMVSGEPKREPLPVKDLFKNKRLQLDEVHKRVLNAAQSGSNLKIKLWKFAPKDANEYSGVFGEWAKVMGAEGTEFLERKQHDLLSGIFSAKALDPNNPKRNIDTKSEAQLMRWSAGAGAEAIFMPFQGSLVDKRDKDWPSRLKRAGKSAQFGIKANAEASFAIGEAKVETIAYIPHAAGWHLGKERIGHPYDFGYFRLRADLSLYAMAGASIALEAEASLLLTAGKQGVRGTPKNSKGAKAKVGGGASADIFAGAKEGIDLAGAVQWLNPEGFIDTVQPKKVDPSKAIAEFVDIGSVTAGLALMEGLAAKLGFEAKFDNGCFVIQAKAGACLGLGGQGNVSGKVGAAQIGQFFMCILHQLKQADYQKLKELMDVRTFKTFNEILYLVVTEKNRIESFIDKESTYISGKFTGAIQTIRQKRDHYIHEIEQELKAGWGWFAYMPPESRGAVIQSLAEPFNLPQCANNRDLRVKAGYCINQLLATTQSSRHLDKTLERITIDLGQKTDRSAGMQLIQSVVAGTPFDNCIARAESQLSKGSPLIGRPFLRNDDGSFYYAQFPLHHKGYDGCGT